MTPAYFAETPPPSLTPKRNEIKRISDKQLAKRKARGESCITRTVSPSRTPIAKRKRKPSEFARIYGSKERVAWVKSRPCVVASPDCWRTIDNAHTATGGTGRKADADTIVPLCRYHHMRLHWWGVATFELGLGVSLAAMAAHTHQHWLLHCGRMGLDPQTGRRGGEK